MIWPTLDVSLCKRSDFSLFIILERDDGIHSVVRVRL